MQQEINLLSKLPRGKRNVNARAEAKTDEIIAISREYGELYFDGPRKYGYGGYRYDGRWIPVAEDMVKHFDLKPGDRVLDVGCGKGFLVKDLIKVCPGLEAFGLDISEYALMHCEPEVVGRLHLGRRGAGQAVEDFLSLQQLAPGQVGKQVDQDRHGFPVRRTGQGHGHAQPHRPVRVGEQFAHRGADFGVSRAGQHLAGEGPAQG